MKKFFLILFYFRIITHLNGQNVQSLVPNIPTSPQAEAFQRYGEYAINYSTGVPDITIPLYEINHRGYIIPLSLKYFPQPLKPGYNYDVFGHGWGFSVNSCVSRTIKSYPDELKDFKIQTEWLDEYFVSCPDCISDHNFAHDKFSVVLPDGSSFDFIMDNDNNQINYLVSNGRNVKITYAADNFSIRSFVIVDESGVRYTFSEGDKPYLGPFTSFQNSYVSWKLSRIDLPYSSEPILFNYNYGIESEYGTVCIEPTIALGNYEYSGELEAWDVPGIDPSYYKMQLLSSITYGNTSIILSFTNPSVMTVYNYVNKIQVIENSSLIRDISLTMVMKNLRTECNSKVVPLAKLNKISIKGSNPSDTPQEYECEYGIISYSFKGTDHWGYVNDSFNDNVANFNLFVECDADQNVGIAHISLLNDTNSGMCPFYDKIKLSTANYNNRQPSSPIQNGVLTRLKYPTGGYTEFEFENHMFLTFTDENGNFILDPKDRIPAFAGGFRIATITNYTEDGIVAETKKFRYGKRYGDGYDPENGYDYNAENYPNIHTGLGEAVVDPNVLTYMQYAKADPCVPSITDMILGIQSCSPVHIFNLLRNESGNCPVRWKCNFSALNFRSLLNGRPSVMYPEVTVYYGDIGEDYDYTPENTNGKTVYKYNISVAGNYPGTGEYLQWFCEPLNYVINTLDYQSRDYLYNTLKERTDYQFNGSDYVLVQKEVNNWFTRFNSVNEYIYNNRYIIGEYPAYTTVGLVMSMKLIDLGFSKLNSKETFLYSPTGDCIMNYETYSFNERYQLTSKRSQMSNGKTKEIIYNYPEDGSTNPVIQNMVNKNIISPVIESKTRIGINSTYNEVNGSKIDFNEFSSGGSLIIMPAQSYELEFKPTGPEYVLKEEIVSYSSNGNPLELISKDGIHNSFIWGYNDRYMIAKVANAENNEIIHTSFEETGGVADANSKTGNKVKISSYSFTTPFLSGTYKLTWWKRTGSLWELQTMDVTIPGGIYQTTLPASSANPIDEIRFYPVNAMMKTYTYSPLIGITSETDENDKTIYYEYDTYGRLGKIRDQDKTVIKEYKYHFKGN